MRIVFMGSAGLAIPSLEAILSSDKDEVVGVVSQPDRPAGRKRVPTACPLKAYAEEQGLLVMTPEKIGEPESVEALRALNADLMVVVAYGQYIPSVIINMAPHSAINVHPSLLPLYRGSAPIQWAIANEDEETGVSIIYLAKRMDAGDIIRQERHPILDSDTSGILHDKLACFGAKLLMEAIEDIRCDRVTRVVQDEDKVVEVRKLTKEDSVIDWTWPAKKIAHKIRANDPWPGSTLEWANGERMKVWASQVEDGDGVPGELLDDQFLVATGAGALRLTEVQPLGKKRMPVAAYLNGCPVKKGTQLNVG